MVTSSASNWPPVASVVRRTAICSRPTSMISSGTLSTLPETSAREQPENLAILLREPFRRMTERLYERLRERGYEDFRIPHGAVFQFVDDDGTSVSELARRAQITKQSMAELVSHLERRGYVERT